MAVVDRSFRALLVPALAVVAALVAAGCSEEAVPIRDVTTTAPFTPHQIQPTEQMRDLAREQCLDDPELDEGVVNAVDPGNPDLVLASVTIDCDEARAAAVAGEDDDGADPEPTTGSSATTTTAP